MLDFGAGRGRWADGGYLQELTSLRGRCLGLYGFDVDPVVLRNDSVDIATHAQVGDPLPFKDAGQIALKGFDQPVRVYCIACS